VTGECAKKASTPVAFNAVPSCATRVDVSITHSFKLWRPEFDRIVCHTWRRGKSVSDRRLFFASRASVPYQWNRIEFGQGARCGWTSNSCSFGRAPGLLIAAGARLWRCEGSRAIRVSVGRAMVLISPNESIVDRSTWRIQRIVTNDGGATWASFGAPPARIASSGSVAVLPPVKIFVWRPWRPSVSIRRCRDHLGTVRRNFTIGQIVADRSEGSLFYIFDPATGTLFLSVDNAANFARESKPAQARSTCCNSRLSQRSMARCRFSRIAAFDRWRSQLQKAAALGQANQIGFGAPATTSAYPTLLSQMAQSCSVRMAPVQNGLKSVSLS